MPMRRRLLLAVAPLAASAAILAGCGDDADDTSAATAGDTTQVEATTGMTGTSATAPVTTPDSVGDDPLVAEISAQNESGVTGDANLIGVDGDMTRVRVSVQGSDGGPHPAHIHRGTCDDLDPTPLYPLTDVVDGTSSTELTVPIADLEGEELAINIHESAENAERYIACGEIE